MTASVIAQVVMVLTLLLMITGKTPIYMTAIVGATLSALIAGFPIMGSAEMTIAKMVNTGLNPVIADILVEAANELDFPIVYPRELLARRAGAMRALTYEMGMHIADLGQKLAQAVTSAEKVKIAAEINRYASEELGGVTFMSDDIHELMGGVGSIPGTTGCLSLFISRKELEQVVYPSLTMDDADQFAELILTGVGKVAARINEALAEYKSATARYSALHDKVFAS